MNITVLNNNFYTIGFLIIITLKQSLCVESYEFEREEWITSRSVFPSHGTERGAGGGYIARGQVKNLSGIDPEGGK